ncbi:MAG: glutaredoxin-like protein YruB-family [Candidatus Saccharibacteria bacterium]|nr:glutaredoxin-like protein YruB-family [Candidatus Saccharibacteria bacterium]
MDETAKVTVYSASWCAFCHMAKNYLNGLGVKFKEIDVDHDHNAAQELVAKTGQAGIPVLEIGESVIIGFDKQGIDKALQENNLLK